MGGPIGRKEGIDRDQEVVAGQAAADAEGAAEVERDRAVEAPEAPVAASSRIH